MDLDVGDEARYLNPRSPWHGNLANIAEVLEPDMDKDGTPGRVIETLYWIRFQVPVYIKIPIIRDGKKVYRDYKRPAIYSNKPIPEHQIQIPHRTIMVDASRLEPT